MGQTSLLICIVAADTATSKNARFKKKTETKKNSQKTAQILKLKGLKQWNLFFFLFLCCIWMIFTHTVTLVISICLLYFCILSQFPFSKRYSMDVLGANLCAWKDDYSQDK